MLLDEFRYVHYLVVGYPCSLGADEQAVLASEEHIAAADQVFGSGFVKNRARVDSLGSLKRHAARDVRFDCSRDDFRIGTLCREDYMNAGSTGLLGYALNVGINFFSALADKIGGFIDDDYDVRNRFRHIGIDFRIISEHVCLGQSFAVIEVVDISDAGAREHFETFFHFRDGPMQGEYNLFIVGDDGNEEVRN